MGKGFPSKAPGGYGTIDEGYRKVYDAKTKRQRHEHVLVWEKHRGPAPKGFHIHHKNDDKLDNRISNLELLTPAEHKRLHAGNFERRRGRWWKRCHRCGRWWPLLSGYYVRNERWRDRITTAPWCKPCSVAYAVDRNRRRARG